MKYLKHSSHPPQAVFKVQPSMNKLEIKDYLRNIYGLPVKKVMTQNMLGPRKRIIGKRKIFYYKRPDFKRAIVTFERGANVYQPKNP